MFSQKPTSIEPLQVFRIITQTLVNPLNIFLANILLLYSLLMEKDEKRCAKTEKDNFDQQTSCSLVKIHKMCALQFMHCGF